MHNEQNTSNILRQLNRNVLFLGMLSMFIAVLIGIYAYVISRDVLIETISNSNLELAQLLGQHSEQLTSDPNTEKFIENLNRVWSQVKKQHPENYICLVDKSGTLLVHSENPKMVGQDVSDNPIQSSETNGISTLRDILTSKQNWSGHYTSLSGQKQITSFAYLPGRESLLAIHVPFDNVEAQLQVITLPWLVGMGSIVFILLPVAMGFLYRASITAQQQLAQTNLKLQQEVHDRQQAEEKVEDAFALLEKTFSSLEDGVLVLDESRKILMCNQSVEHIFGYKTNELIGHETDILHIDKESFDRFGNEVTRALGTKSYITFEYQMRRKDGTIFPTEHTINKFTGDIDSKNYTVSVVRDISERKKMQEALIEGEVRFSQLAKHINEVFWLSDTSKNEMLYISPGYEKIWGRTCASLYDSPKTWIDAIHPDDRDRIQQAAQTKQSQGTYDEEYRIVRPDGTHRLIRDRAFPIRNEAGDIYRIAGLAEDITERRKFEQEQIRIQRINALGELSAGVSHNLNNILSGIMGPAQLLKLSVTDPQQQQDIDTILTSSKRARDLVQRLHRSTRGLEDEPIRSIDLNKTIEDAIKGTQPRWKDEAESKGISIAINTQLDLVLPIKATVSACYDLLVNLIFNAVDAMPDGGTITIQTQQCDDHTQLTFSDTGIGMDTQTKERIFEPFFTTKVDVGTGLGLCTVYNSIIKWGGQIDVESELGEGTTFTFQLPNTTRQDLQTEKAGAPEQKRPGKILIIEDDPQIRRFLSRYLSNYHEIVCFENGQEALDAFSPNDYDAAIIDLGLAHMPGDQIAKQVQIRDPALSTILITGWELAQNDPRLSSFDFKLKKPFDDLIVILDILNQAIALHDTRLREN